jgi:hypothetical protein
MSTIEMTAIDQAAALAVGLRDLAALVTEHPELALVVRRAVDMMASVGHGEENARDLIVASARAGLARGAAVTEYDNGQYAGVHVAFGPVRVQVYAAVEKVHRVTRIVEYTPRSILAELGGTTTEVAAA